MKKIFKGFTLAEVLVTLATIGIVAALTLPNLNRLSNASQVGPAVAKAMNTLENANRLWLQDNNARRISSECIQAINYFSDACIGKYLAGGLEVINESKETVDFNFKDGTRFQTNGKSGTDKIYIFFDLKKKDSPQIGRDRFYFYVLNTGDVVAYGSNAYKKMYPNSNYWNSAEWGCSNNTDYEAALEKGLSLSLYSCTGSIVDNNFKVLYFD